DGQHALGLRAARGVPPRPDARAAAASGDAQLHGGRRRLQRRARGAEVAGRAVEPAAADTHRGPAAASRPHPEPKPGSAQRAALRSSGVRADRGALRVARLAFFSPLPPAATGIADYTVDVLNVLSSTHVIDVFHDQDTVETDRLPAACRAYAAREF